METETCDFTSDGAAWQTDWAVWTEMSGRLCALLWRVKVVLFIYLFEPCVLLMDESS